MGRGMVRVALQCLFDDAHGHAGLGLGVARQLVVGRLLEEGRHLAAQGVADVGEDGGGSRRRCGGAGHLAVGAGAVMGHFVFSA